jgi:poly-gamma-glutamate synthesis protein (capsule biosynthesis protein)
VGEGVRAAGPGLRAWLLVFVSCRGGVAPAADAGRDGRASDGRTTEVLADVTVGDAVDGAVVDARGARRVLLTLAGDVLLSPPVVHQAEAHREGGRLGWVLGPLASFLRPQALSVASLRGPLGSRATLAARGAGRWGAPAEFARDLGRVGLDVLDVSSERALDLGPQGVEDTLAALRGAGVRPLGACMGGPDACPPVVQTLGGVRVALLGFNASGRGLRFAPEGAPRVESLASGAAPAALLDAVRGARTVADVVLLSLTHATERDRAWDAERRGWVTAALEAGADVVVCHGRDRLGPVERVSTPRGEGVIAWSLGALVSSHGGGWHVGIGPSSVAQNPWVYDPSLRESALLHVTFGLGDDGRLAVTGLYANVLWLSHQGGELQVVPLRSVDERVRALRLSSAQTALGGQVRVRP